MQRTNNQLITTTTTTVDSINNNKNNNNNRLHKIIDSSSNPAAINNFKKSVLYELTGSLNSGTVAQNVPKFRMNTRDFELLASSKHKEIHPSQVLLRLTSPSGSRRPSVLDTKAITSNGVISSTTTSKKKPKSYLSALLTPLGAYSVYSECK